MNASTQLNEFIKASGYQHDLLAHPAADSSLQTAICANIEPATLARTILLSDEEGPLLAVFPASHCIDLTVLNRQLHRNLKPADSIELNTLFPGCDHESLPPIDSAATLTSIVDNALADEDVIHFPAGSNKLLIRMLSDDFYGLLENAMHGLCFSHSLPGLAKTVDASQGPANLPESLRQHLAKMDSLPGIPETARELLLLRNRPHSQVHDLARVIEKDPLLAAQIIKLSRSAMYAFRGKINSLNDAIFRVLGYDTALAIALGMSTSGNFKGPRDGRLGQRRLYRDAMFVSALGEMLAKQMPAARRPVNGTTQLAGLLHNIGYALLAHLLPEEYKALNQQVSNHENLSAWHAVAQHFSTTAGDIGAWLMSSWEMPEFVIIAEREQRNINYRGAHAVPCQLVLLVNRLLHRYGIGDADTDELPVYILQELGIDADTAIEQTAILFDQSAELDALARQMVA